jgi:hypothetical protein
MKTLLLVATLALASFASAEDSGDTLLFFLSKSDLVVTGRIQSDPMGSVDKKGYVAYLCQFKVDDVLKGDSTLKGTVIWVGIGRHEVGEKDRNPLIKMDGECLLFLKTSPQNSPTWVTADSWFGIQHPWPSMIGSLRRLAGEVSANPSTAKPVALPETGSGAKE